MAMREWKTIFQAAYNSPSETQRVSLTQRTTVKVEKLKSIHY